MQMQKALPGLEVPLSQKPIIVFIGSCVNFSNDLVTLVVTSFPDLHVKRYAALADFVRASGSVREATIATILDESYGPDIEMCVSQMQQAAPYANHALSYRDLDRAAAIAQRVSHLASLAKLSFLPMRTQYDSWRSMLILLMNGDCYMPRELVAVTLPRVPDQQEHSLPDSPAEQLPPTPRASPARPILTDREMEVLELVARGMQNKNVAADLGLSENTVKLHMHNIISKLGVRNRTGATVWYVTMRDAL